MLPPDSLGPTTRQALRCILAEGVVAVRLIAAGDAREPGSAVVRVGLPPAGDAMTEAGTCPLCGRPTLCSLANLHHVRVHRCAGCGSGVVMQVRERASDGGCCEVYSANYESERVADKARACWNLLLHQAGGLRGVQRILDIGCGEGAFLDLARQAGLETAGIEISLNAALEAALKGHEVLCGSATQVRFPPGVEFDVVVMWDLLEHLPQPGRALALARDALAAEGRLFIVTPMMGSVFDRAGLAAFRFSRGRFDRLARMCWDHNHLFRFDPRGVCEVLRDMGYARASARSVQLLSLRSEHYAGGKIMPGWTRSTRANRGISYAGVALAKLLGLHNKILIEATKKAP